MRNTFVALAILVLFASHAFSLTPADTPPLSKDQTYNKMIIGKWSEKMGETYGIASFEEGGNYQAWVYENRTKQNLLYTIKGKWWIQGGKLFNTASEIAPPAPGFDSSKVVVDKIVQITDDSMTLIDEEFNEYTNTRLKDDAKEADGARR